MIEIVMDFLMDIIDSAEDREAVARGVVGVALILYSAYSVRPFVEEHVDERLADLVKHLDIVYPEYEEISIFDRFRRIIDILEAVGE